VAISYQTFKNVKTVTIGSTPMYGVQSVTVSKDRAVIQAAGDGDTYVPIARAGTCAVSGSIATVDPTDADSWDGLAGTLSFVYTDAQGTTDKTVTIVGVSITSVNQGVSRDAPSSGSVSFVAESADGTTDPVSIA